MPTSMGHAQALTNTCRVLRETVVMRNHSKEIASPWRRRVSQAFMVATIVLVITGLAQASGLSNVATAAVGRAIDEAPMVLGIEDEARVELNAPIPVSQLPVLAAEWGIRVEAFQYTYAAPNRPITVGGVIPSGADGTAILADQNRSVSAYIQARLTRMASQVTSMSGLDKTSMEQNVVDFRTVEADIAANGVRASVITIRGASARVAQLVQDPRVHSLAKR